MRVWIHSGSVFIWSAASGSSRSKMVKPFDSAGTGIPFGSFMIPPMTARFCPS